MQKLILVAFLATSSLASHAMPRKVCF
jgi:hypothetical protein